MEREEFLSRKLGRSFNVDDLSVYKHSSIGKILGAIRTNELVVVIGSEGLLVDERGMVRSCTYPLSISHRGVGEFSSAKHTGTLVVSIRGSQFTIEKAIPATLAADLLSARHGFADW